MKHIIWLYFTFFTIILIYIPYSAFTSIERRLIYTSKPIYYDYYKSELETTRNRIDLFSKRYKTLDSLMKNDSTIDLEKCNETVQFYKSEIKSYTILKERFERDFNKKQEEYDNEIFKSKKGKYTYYFYCLLLIFMEFFLLYQIYFNQKFTVTITHGILCLLYFICIFIDASLLSELLYCSNLSLFIETNLYFGYIILIISLVVKYIYFTRKFSNYIITERNRYFNSKTMWFLNIIEMIVLFYYIFF